MSTSQSSRPEVALHRSRNGATLYVRLGTFSFEFDFEFLPELRSMLRERFDLQTTGEILQQACRLSEGVA